MASLKFHKLLFSAVLFIFCVLHISAFELSDEQSKRLKPRQDWPNHGGDLYNRRYANKDQDQPYNCFYLSLKWNFYAGGDITVTPSIYDGILYFPSWNGYLFAVKVSDGSLVWKKNLEQLKSFNNTGFILNVNSTVSRSTPTVAVELLIVGIYGPCFCDCYLYDPKGILLIVYPNRFSGIGKNQNCIPQQHRSFYVGTSSLEEGVSLELCCTFRSSFAKLDAKTGKILWQTFMLPENFGKTGLYAGGAIWGSSPTIDIQRNFVYIATGNLCSAPPHVIECQGKVNNQTNPIQPDKCIEPENHSNSILAIDLDSGKIKWYKQLGGYDVWFGACSWHLDPRYPPGPSPDADFAEAPMTLSIFVNGAKNDIVVAVQKSGFSWALDRDNGSIVWSKVAGPRGLGYGARWDAATDKSRAYTNIANSQHKNFTLKPSQNSTIAGGWVATEPRNGNVLWTTANPNDATAPGPVTVAPFPRINLPDRSMQWMPTKGEFSGHMILELQYMEACQ
ncbi:hypothetical protein L6164_008416 [Bauhinia variegata]|uniref:Uncharacterized protein n=1 Tax=Bauhinia variegata TaxID=167791 RepID=A0ACB9PGX7_BAUVA|nr:hypothetical protein L6164_008416 [Bauhinia variegata]